MAETAERIGSAVVVGQTPDANANRKPVAGPTSFSAEADWFLPATQAPNLCFPPSWTTPTPNPPNSGGACSGSRSAVTGSWSWKKANLTLIVLIPLSFPETGTVLAPLAAAPRGLAPLTTPYPGPHLDHCTGTTSACETCNVLCAALGGVETEGPLLTRSSFHEDALWIPKTDLDLGQDGRVRTLPLIVPEHRNSRPCIGPKISSEIGLNNQLVVAYSQILFVALAAPLAYLGGASPPHYRVTTDYSAVQDIGCTPDHVLLKPLFLFETESARVPDKLPWHTCIAAYYNTSDPCPMADSDSGHGATLTLLKPVAKASMSYQITNMLGSGAFGAAILGTLHGEQTAIKFVDIYKIENGKSLIHAELEA
ncbi:hypothetical protein BDK51DRAFT_44620 [Blyttiomyces helicus]|uniref:Protein kinase domain-containing protein n=1 Tax=Blyttiomyces helicus TaxID=388810 RepID=A0A4P9WDE4_9FUNG|nr:hypothetical protein BDK51DRAFT_44620 [Blyttiomyces helicus]|eukprot:RKO89683.1 hypothetical protein BDK51DRAFT_44620 [Blyttiomyces helicus]